MMLFKRNKLKDEIKRLEAERDRIAADNNEIAARYDILLHKADEAQRRYNELTGAINVIETREDYCIPYYDDSLDVLEHKRHGMQAAIDAEIRNGLYSIKQQYRVDGSEAKGREMQKAMGDGFCYALNCYITDKERSLTDANISKSKELISKRFDKLQKKASKVGIELNPAYVRKRLAIMDVNLAIKVNKKKEAARIREEKRRLREQEQLLEEIAKEEARLNCERKAMDVAFAKALTDNERSVIKGDMAKIDKRLNDLRYRREHNKAGWLYVISSPSLPGIVKVGCTRQLNPVMRVKQLSSSSLPYAFRTHGFVFSDDCFALESAMHHYFDDRRVAPDREFFNITPKEAIDVLENKFGVEVHFADYDEESEDDNGED
jgi:hypothetical protein